VTCFYGTQQYATNLNIELSQGSVATYFRCDGWCYTQLC